MGKLRKACANCIKYKLACETKRPCSRCVLHQCSCIDVERKPRAARRPKRPRTSLEGPDGIDTSIPITAPSAPAPSLKSSSNAPFVPELVLNDNEPLFSANFDTNPFMMQSTEASLLPFNDIGLMMNSNLNNGFLSSVLMLDHDQASLGVHAIPKIEPGLNLYDEMVRKVDYPVKPQPLYNLSPQAFAQNSPTVGSSNKFVIPSPQPLVIMNKNEWSVVDCNLEFAQFLGYTTVAEFNASLDAMNVIIPEAIGLSKQNFEYLLNAKVNHFERLGMLKSKEGNERTVTLHVDIMEKLMMFTVKEVYDMRPMCLYTRWLKAVAPSAITPCDRVRCQCRLYDYNMVPQPQLNSLGQPTLSL